MSDPSIFLIDGYPQVLLLHVYTQSKPFSLLLSLSCSELKRVIEMHNVIMQAHLGPLNNDKSWCAYHFIRKTF